MIETPYLLFLGDAPDQLAAKVAQGIRDWRPEHAVGQFRLPNCGADVGLLWLSDRYLLGTTLVNVNEPDFDYPDLDLSAYTDPVVCRM